MNCVVSKSFPGSTVSKCGVWGEKSTYNMRSSSGRERGRMKRSLPDKKRANALYVEHPAMRVSLSEGCSISQLNQFSLKDKKGEVKGDVRI